MRASFNTFSFSFFLSEKNQLFNNSFFVGGDSGHLMQASLKTMAQSSYIAFFISFFSLSKKIKFLTIKFFFFVLVDEDSSHLMQASLKIEACKCVAALCFSFYFVSTKT